MVSLITTSVRTADSAHARNTCKKNLVLDSRIRPCDIQSSRPGDHLNSSPGGNCASEQSWLILRSSAFTFSDGTYTPPAATMWFAPWRVGLCCTESSAKKMSIVRCCYITAVHHVNLTLRQTASLVTAASQSSALSGSREQLLPSLAVSGEFLENID
jgi:hypothetical protein